MIKFNAICLVKMYPYKEVQNHSQKFFLKKRDCLPNVKPFALSIYFLVALVNCFACIFQRF